METHMSLQDPRIPRNELWTSSEVELMETSSKKTKNLQHLFLWTSSEVELMETPKTVALHDLLEFALNFFGSWTNGNFVERKHPHSTQNFELLRKLN